MADTTHADLQALDGARAQITFDGKGKRDGTIRIHPEREANHPIYLEAEDGLIQVFLYEVKSFKIEKSEHG